MPRLESFYEDEPAYRAPDFVLRWYDRWKGQVLLEGKNGRQWVKGLELWAAGVHFLPTEEPLSEPVLAKLNWEHVPWQSASIPVLSSVDLVSPENTDNVISRIQFFTERRLPGFDYLVERKQAGFVVSRNESEVLTTHKVWRDSDRRDGHIGHFRWAGEPGHVLDAYVGVLAVHCIQELP